MMPPGTTDPQALSSPPPLRNHPQLTLNRPTPFAWSFGWRASVRRTRNTHVINAPYLKTPKEFVHNFCVLIVVDKSFHRDHVEHEKHRASLSDPSPAGMDGFAEIAGNCSLCKSRKPGLADLATTEAR